ncbi:hypothetical protein [Anaerovorax odorimutans]|uniref:hypothetical protein n=1 Tax=Anaerovorax odorimutans TaxID=109327 RepID=UPI0004196ACF|nr:hypothetical protein [Anaerovorax odorimutans]
MTEKELNTKKCSCGDGKEIDEYLNCTICEPAKEEEDVTVPGDADYEVSVEEKPKKDPEEEGAKHYLNDK